MSNAILKLIRIIRTENNVRSVLDNRVKVNRVVCSYTDGSDEYRKSFEQRVAFGGEIDIPEEGNHKKLNGMKYQWRENTK